MVVSFAYAGHRDIIMRDSFISGKLLAVHLKTKQYFLKNVTEHVIKGSFSKSFSMIMIIVSGRGLTKEV